MIVFRITIDKYADALHPSGNPARWNSRDVKVIYTTGSRALACLENLVHRNSRGLHSSFKTILIEIPDNLEIKTLNKDNLKPGWQQYAEMPYTQQIGDEWVQSQSSAVLRIPSVIIPEENNYLINFNHVDFNKIKILSRNRLSLMPGLKRQIKLLL